MTEHYRHTTGIFAEALRDVLGICQLHEDEPKGSELWALKQAIMATINLHLVWLEEGKKEFDRAGERMHKSVLAALPANPDVCGQEEKFTSQMVRDGKRITARAIKRAKEKPR